jgi:hypothetical protein
MAPQNTFVPAMTANAVQTHMNLNTDNYLVSPSISNNNIVQSSRQFPITGDLSPSTPSRSLSPFPLPLFSFKTVPVPLSNSHQSNHSTPFNHNSILSTPLTNVQLPTAFSASSLTVLPTSLLTMPSNTSASMLSNQANQSQHPMNSPISYPSLTPTPSPLSSHHSF